MRRQIAGMNAKEYDRQWYDSHPEYVKRQTRLKSQRRELHRKKLQAYKADAGCKDCGERDPVVLQFHHTDGNTKEFAVSTTKALSRCWERIMEEVKKCVVVCANCHLRRHHAK